MAAARHPRRLLLARGPVLLGLALVSVACSSTPATTVASDGVPSRTSAPPTTSPPKTQTAVLPLTGEPAGPGQEVSAPVVAVAVESGRDAPPPEGVDEADLVYLSFPGPDRQRALALFHSRDAERVGPVADVRPLDVKLLRPLGAVLQHAGGTAGFVLQVGRAGLPEWSSLVHPETFDRDPASGAVYGSTQAARGADGAAPARPGLLAFRDGQGTSSGAAGRVEVEIEGQRTVRLEHDDRSGWRGEVGSFALQAQNVVVQEVEYADLVLPKTGGLVEGNPQADGRGDVTLLSGGEVSTGTWNRPGGRTSTKYVRDDGTAVRLLPGRTWVLLVPEGSSVDR